MRPRVFRKEKSAGGFSYIEVLICLAIVAICMVSLLGLYVRQIKTAGDLVNVRYATLLADEKLAGLRASLDIAAGRDSGTTKINNTDFKWHITVNDEVPPTLPQSLQQKLFDVTVVVRWGKFSSGNAVKLNTLIRKQEPL